MWDIPQSQIIYGFWPLSGIYIYVKHDQTLESYGWLCPIEYLGKSSYFTHLKTRPFGENNSPHPIPMIPGFGRTGFGRLNMYPSTVVYLPWGYHQQYNYKHVILFDIFLYIYILYPVVPSGKRLQFANWKITMLFMGKSTISMAIFNSQLFVYQRVIHFPMIFHQNLCILSIYIYIIIYPIYSGISWYISHCNQKKNMISLGSKPESQISGPVVLLNCWDQPVECSLERKV